MRPLIVFDIEATCDANMARKKREIIEIGAIKIVNGVVVDSFSSLVKPKQHPQLTSYCKNLTHIKQSDIDSAQDPHTVLLAFAEWSKNCVLAAWGEFDSEIIQKEMHKNKIENELVFINFKKVYLSIRKLPFTYSLQDALKSERIHFQGAMHRAYDDAYNTYLIYEKNKTKMDEMIRKIYSRNAFLD